MTEAIVRARGLRKRYGDREVVRGSDLDVRAGEALALLGPNGAGKTTVVEILTGFRSRSAGGQRRRLDIGLALIGRPDLLFLDEPTAGFDPKARRDAWAMIDGLRRLGTTIVLTTHAMDEAERLAERIAVIVDGAVVAQGMPATIGGRDRHAHEISFTLPTGRRVSMRSAEPLADLRALADWASERGIDLPDLEVRRPALEDVYLALAGSPTTTDSEEA
jgi:ABC-2 type transport system ATP-binding protein